jgi:hypothetical protein
MLRKFAAGLLATALIAGPAFAQTSTSSMPSGTAPNAAAPASQNQAAPAKVTTTPAKQTANPSKTVKHAKLHKKTVKHVASRSHLKSGKVHQVRHVKSVKTHQAKAATAAKRS